MGGFRCCGSGADCTIDWVKAIFAGGQTLSAERIEAWDARRRERHTVNLGPDSPFTEPKRRRVSWALPMTRAEILGLVGTYSVAITMSATARQEHVASISRHLDTHTALASDWNSGDADVLPVLASGTPLTRLPPGSPISLGSQGPGWARGAVGLVVGWCRFRLAVCWHAEPIGRPTFATTGVAEPAQPAQPGQSAATG